MAFQCSFGEAQQPARNLQSSFESRQGVDFSVVSRRFGMTVPHNWHGSKGSNNRNGFAVDLYGRQ